MQARAEAAKIAKEQKALKTGEPIYSATQDLWVYEKDKTSGAADWEHIPKQAQGISVPSKRTDAATAVLGHMMYLFGGMDPETDTLYNDIWTLSLKTNKWSLCQAFLPYGVSGHSAVAISDTTIALHTKQGLLLYYDDGPTPIVVEQSTTGEGPDGLSLCASCGISRNDNTKSSNSDSNGGSDSTSDYSFNKSQNKLDMLVFGGSTGASKGFSSAAYVLNTESWSWKKLQPQTTIAPLQSPCLVPLSNSNSDSDSTNNKCIVFGGAKLENGTPTTSDETWLLEVSTNDNMAHWKRIATDDEEGVCPEGRTAASLTATPSGEIVLQGGWDPITKKTYGGPSGGGTWILTKDPIDPQTRIDARKKVKDMEQTAAEAAASKVSDIIAAAGSGSNFNGTSLGVGGLEDVLEEIKTRIWTPLAAPPQLLKGAL